jgi:thiol-disulfide isomerase/thioredoxin
MHLAILLYLSLVNDVRNLIARHDLAGAEKATRAYQQQSGTTPEYAAALSWLGRAALAERQLDQADAFASETRKAALDLMRTRKMDADPWLPTAMGASIEVHALVLAARGERSDAVAFLRQQSAAYSATSIGERIRKNLNLLSLEGKPAPALETREWLSGPPSSPPAFRGHPVLMFFWAHWCPDCKAEAPILASLVRTYGPKGLTVVAPTRLYGYVAGGADAPPAVEKKYIESVRQQYYPAMAAVPIPLSTANFLTYGCSTTPTLVLTDAAGIVRYYHPGAASEADLAIQIQKVLAK